MLYCTPCQFWKSAITLQAAAGCLVLLRVYTLILARQPFFSLSSPPAHPPSTQPQGADPCNFLTLCLGPALTAYKKRDDKREEQVRIDKLQAKGRRVLAQVRLWCRTDYSGALVGAVGFSGD